MRKRVLAKSVAVAALKLGMLAAPTAEDIAKIVATRALSNTDSTVKRYV